MIKKKNYIFTIKAGIQYYGLLMVWFSFKIAFKTKSNNIEFSNVAVPLVGL